MARTDVLPDTAEHAVKQAYEALGGVQKSENVLRWIKEKYPSRWDDETLRNYIRACSVNYPKAISYDPDFPRFLFRHGIGKYELYQPDRHGIFDEQGHGQGLAGISNTTSELRELADEIEGGNEFAYESHLRDYLAKNLNILEAGLTLWENLDTSVEYSLEGRRIDILAKDREGVPVVIELKLSRGHERTIGQALYYRGKLRQVLGVSRVRIMMVARDITDELRIASNEVSDVSLFCYELTMRVTPISAEK
ncbi:MAG TPA: endonuclease NucS domain-containing protein [Acidobacteriaceae bacterium]|nr:endonuclease NucS domain-containing protein [Acidobacteriaceae bacterium]